MTETDNMRLWNAVCTTDPAHTKPVSKGAFKITAIDAMYQKQLLTQHLGIAGIDWYVEDKKFELIRLDPENCHSDMLAYQGILYFTYEGKQGMISLAADIDVWMTTRNGTVRNQDIFKKVKTDALTKGISDLGFNADVFLGKFDDSKYVSNLRQEYQDETPTQQRKTYDRTLELGNDVNVDMTAKSRSTCRNCNGTIYWEKINGKNVPHDWGKSHRHNCPQYQRGN